MSRMMPRDQQDPRPGNGVYTADGQFQGIIKAPHLRDFTIVDNAVINDRRLKSEALGVLVYLISKPVDWIVRTKDVQRRFSIGHTKAEKIFRTFVQLGYGERVEHREGGRFVRRYLVIHELPLKKRPPSGPSLFDGIAKKRSPRASLPREAGPHAVNRRPTKNGAPTKKEEHTTTAAPGAAPSLDKDKGRAVEEESAGEDVVVVSLKDEPPAEVQRGTRAALKRIGFPDSQATRGAKFNGATTARVEEIWTRIGARIRRDPASVNKDPKALLFDALKYGYTPFDEDGWQTEAEREDRQAEQSRWAASGKSDQELLDSLNDQQFEQCRIAAIRGAAGDADIIRPLRAITRGQLRNLAKFKRTRELLAAEARDLTTRQKLARGGGS